MPESWTLQSKVWQCWSWNQKCTRTRFSPCFIISLLFFRVGWCKLSQVIDWKLDRGPRFAQERAAHIFSICEQLLALQHWNVSCWLYVSWPFRQQAASWALQRKRGQEPLLVLAVLRRAARHWEAFFDCSQLLLNATPTVWRRSFHFKAVWCVPCSSQKLSCWKARPACNGAVGSLKHCKPSRSSWPWKDCHGASPCKGNRTTFVWS